jgi:hypothetical protein
MSVDAIAAQLEEYLSACPVTNTHSHHLRDDEFQDVSLFKLVSRSYVNWIMDAFSEDGPEARAHFLVKHRCNSYATWLIRAIEALHPVGRPLSLDTWDAYDAAIREAYGDPQHHLRILAQRCGYHAVILDKYDDPGADNGHPELFKPTLRCDPFFSGYDPALRSHDGVSAYDTIAYTPGMTLAEYVARLRERIVQARQVQGIIALKIGMAYERPLDFCNRDARRAERAFLNPAATAPEICDFQDYIMYTLAGFAAELDLPIQIHTGLGQLKGTNAMGLCELIEQNPGVRFDLFHGSYPWTDDILALAHNFNRVYVDLCWLPIISTSRAVAFVKEALEVTDAGRILWGCDTWTSEESYGALLAGRYCIAKALAEMVAEGRFDLAYAKSLGENILDRNARQLFGI